MKKLFLLVLLFAALNSDAQLSKGSQLAGLQFNLAVNDLYSVQFHAGTRGFGLSGALTYGYAVADNWLAGAFVTIGYDRAKDPMFTTYQTIYHSRDLGIAPFTRYYLDITTDKKLKFFGQAAVEINNVRIRNTYEGGTAPATTTYSSTGVAASIGGGLGYFGRKLCFDFSFTTQAMRFGLYKVIGAKK